MVHRLTFVCEANVCRSPLMAFTFANDADAGLDADWRVHSRGTGVGGRRMPICDVAAGLIAESSGAAEFAKAHRSAPVRLPELRKQDLIIVASLAERSAIATLDPDLRTRTFTLREAIALGSEPITAIERERGVGADSDADAVAAYAAMLHARRGLAVGPSTPRARPWRRRPRSPFDIADAHHHATRRHSSMLRALQADVRALRAQMAAFILDD